MAKRGRLAEAEREEGRRGSPRLPWNPSRAKEVARLSPGRVLLSLREVRPRARPLRGCGALARPWRRGLAGDFCNCVRARWRRAWLGRGGRGTSAAAHVTAAFLWGLATTQAGGGGDRAGAEEPGLSEEEEMTEGASPSPHGGPAASPGKPRSCRLRVGERARRPVPSSA